MKVEIKFFTYWHCDLGGSGGAKADALVVKDADGLPYVPGKTLKGLAREMAETLSDETFVDKYFGRASSEGQANTDRAEGEAYFGNAVLTERVDANLASYLYHTISSTAIEDNGLAKTGSLREIEVVVPLTLQATVSGIGEDDKANMKQAFEQIKHIGLNRHRGLGRCEVSVIEEGQR